MQRDIYEASNAPRTSSAVHRDSTEDASMNGSNQPGAEDGFVVPEPDGVQSGVPFEAVNGPGAPRSGPGATAATSGGPGAGATVQGVAGAFMRSGLSLKLKLFLSIGLLTLLILVLGVISFVSLHAVSVVGISDLREEARLAYRTERLATSLHRMYEAERDLEQGGASAIQHLQRRLEAVQQDLISLEAEASTHGSTAQDFAAQHATMAELLASYESQIDTYSASVASFRQQNAAQQDAKQPLIAMLSERVESVMKAIAELSASHWRRGTVDSDDDAISLGLGLGQLERDLSDIAADVDRFLRTEDAALAAAAEESLGEVLTQLEVLRDKAGWRTLSDGLSQIREQLQGYSALLRDAVQRTADALTAKVAASAALEDQAQTLLATAGQALDHVESLAAAAWLDIETDSDGLESLGSGARWLVGVTAGIGFAIGLLVLVTVPRPIVRSIDQLLKGALEIARGNLTIPIQSASRDELGQLAATFENMRRNLVGLVQRIQRASVQLSSSINEIQAATTEQASSASEQASAANELSASLNQMSQSASTLLTSAESVGGSVSGIAETLNESDQSSSRILSSMDAIGVSTEQTAERIKALNDKMDDINEAVATISMVADQTTLLSLNASIEANKAGEMGKGFSVVASEIRRLSDRSIDSAGNINGMVRDIQRATESSALAMDKSSEEIRHGVTLVRDSTEALASINRSMERILEQMEMILENVRAQADSSRMVQTTAGEMLSSANMVSKAAGQTRSVSYELNAMATQLASAVSVFRI